MPDLMDMDEYDPRTARSVSQYLLGSDPMASGQVADPHPLMDPTSYLGGVGSMFLRRPAAAAASYAVHPAAGAQPSLELEAARRAFINRFGHAPPDSISNQADVLMRWVKGRLNSAPAAPGVGYDKYGRPLESTMKHRIQRDAINKRNTDLMGPQ